MTANDLDIFAYHCYLLSTDVGTFGLSWTCLDGTSGHCDIVITQTVHSLNEPVWDNVTVNGKSVGNRHGGLKAYARLVAEGNGFQ